MVLIMAPIGSGAPGGTKCGGRSGRFFSASYCVASSGFELQMALGQALQPRRRVELGPFGAQRRDGVALLADFARAAADALGARGRFHLDPVDIGRGKHQHADARGDGGGAWSASPHRRRRARPGRQRCRVGMRRRRGALGGAQLRRARARIGGDLGISRRRPGAWSGSGSSARPARPRADAATRRRPCRARPGNS